MVSQWTSAFKLLHWLRQHFSHAASLSLSKAVLLLLWNMFIFTIGMHEDFQVRFFSPVAMVNRDMRAFLMIVVVVVANTVQVAWPNEYQLFWNRILIVFRHRGNQLGAQTETQSMKNLLSGAAPGSMYAKAPLPDHSCVDWLQMTSSAQDDSDLAYFLLVFHFLLLVASWLMGLLRDRIFPLNPHSFHHLLRAPMLKHSASVTAPLPAVCWKTT